MEPSNEEKQYEPRGADGRFVRGGEPGPGHPPGVPNWNTLMRRAVKKIAAESSIDEEEVWTSLLRKAFEEAKKGNHHFYGDIMNRQFGKPKESLDVTTNGQSIVRDPQREEELKEMSGRFNKFLEETNDGTK